MQKSKTSRFCISATALNSWEILARFQGFSFQFFDHFTVANEFQFIGKDFVAWRAQGYNHHARALTCS